VNHRHINSKTRTRFLELVEDILYKPARKRMMLRMNKIILSNSIAHGNMQKTMTYRGKWYFKDNKRFYISPPFFINPVHPTVRPQFKDWLAEEKSLDEEKFYIDAYILAAISISPVYSSLKIMLPEALHQVLHYPRPRLFARSLSDEGVTPFLEDMSDVSPAEIKAFMQNNEKYYMMIKRRLAKNLIEG